MRLTREGGHLLLIGAREPNAEDERMTGALAAKHCVPCRGGIPPLAEVAARALGAAVPAWTIEGGARRIARRFRFADFAAALAFVQAVGALAEEEFHHPEITFGWGFCTVSLETKKIKGLHENDFIMAAKIDALAAAAP